MNGLMLYGEIKKLIRMSKTKNSLNITAFCKSVGMSQQHFSWKMRKMRDENKVDQKFVEKIKEFFY